MEPRYAGQAMKSEGPMVCSAKPISAEVAEYAERLASRANQLAERLGNKLHSVVSSENPQPCEVCKGEREYPPLFADLRGNFKTIESALDVIESLISRTEL